MGVMKRLMSVLFFSFLWLLAGHALGPSVAQELPTATPDAAGIIYVTVQPNDNLWTIAFRHGLTLAELLALNDLNENALIQPGDRLIVGYGPPPATPTVPVPPTPTLPPPTPTATPAPPPTAICLLAFVDLNGNGRFDVGESLQDAVAFTIFDETAVVANYITDGFSEPYCIEGLPPGNYNVTRSLRSGEQATTPGDMAITLAWGDRVELAFGAVLSDVSPDEATAVPDPTSMIDNPPVDNVVDNVETAVLEPTATAENGRSVWLWLLAACGLLGMAVLVAAGLAIYLFVARPK